MIALGSTDADSEKIVPAAIEALRLGKKRSAVRPVLRWGGLGRRRLPPCPSCKGN